MKICSEAPQQACAFSRHPVSVPTLRLCAALTQGRLGNDTYELFNCSEINST